MVSLLISIVIYNSLLLCGPCDKEERIRQQPELMDGAVMELLASWNGWRAGMWEGRVVKQLYGGKDT